MAKQDIQEFRDWCFNMANLWDLDSHEEYKTVGEKLMNGLHGTTGSTKSHSYGIWNLDSLITKYPHIIRDIICDKDNLMRSQLGYIMMHSCVIRYDHLELCIAYVKTRFNREINRLCGFNKEVK